MNDAERLAHLRECLCQHFTRDEQQGCTWCFLLTQLDAVTAERDAARKMFTRDEWGDDDGDVLWWSFPVEEPPYFCGVNDAPSWCTHWTRIVVPEARVAAALKEQG